MGLDLFNFLRCHNFLLLVWAEHERTQPVLSVVRASGFGAPHKALDQNPAALRLLKMRYGLVKEESVWLAPMVTVEATGPAGKVTI